MTRPTGEGETVKAPTFRKSLLDRLAGMLWADIIEQTGDGEFADYVVDWLRENVKVVDG